MKQRLRKAGRIVAVQNRCTARRNGGWPTFRAPRPISNACAVNSSKRSTKTLRPLLVEVVARRLKATAAEADRLAQEQMRQEAKVREEAQRLKRAERMHENVSRQYDRHQEHIMVAGILEGIAARLSHAKDDEPGAPGDASLT